MTPTLADFTKGQRVRYVGAKAPYVGCLATVKRPVKSRGVVTVVFDLDGKWFDAIPKNLEAAP